jgi:hypothetical protein
MDIGTAIVAGVAIYVVGGFLVFAIGFGIIVYVMKKFGGMS